MIERFDIEALRDWSIDTVETLEDYERNPVPSTLRENAFPSIARITPTIYRLIFDPLFAIDVDSAAKTVLVCPLAAQVDSDDLHHILYDHIAPRLISIRHTVLHGAAVEIEGRLAILIGETGAGKSTLSASLWQAGHGLLGDDAVIVSDGRKGPRGKAVYPSLRLHPASIDAVFDHPVKTARMAHYSEKRRFDLAPSRGDGVCEYPIAAIFNLAHTGGAVAPTIELMPPAKACFTCMAQSFALDPAEAGPARERLAALSRLVSHIPVFELDYPRDYAALPGVHDLIAAKLD